jgi:hypothetical protein
MNWLGHIAYGGKKKVMESVKGRCISLFINGLFNDTVSSSETTSVV